MTTDGRCGIVDESDIVYIPDSPVVERCVKRDLQALSKHILHCDDSVVDLTMYGFGMLPEYSHSFPTGRADGKVWKRYDKVKGWQMVEYVDMGDPARWNLKWRRILVRGQVPR